MAKGELCTVWDCSPVLQHLGRVMDGENWALYLAVAKEEAEEWREVAMRYKRYNRYWAGLCVLLALLCLT